VRLSYSHAKEFVVYDIELDQKVKQVVPVREKVNWVFIYDRSGSMYYTLKQLVEDMITHLEKIPNGDTLTIGWFSSQGQYNWIFKGLGITDNYRKAIAQTLRENNTTIGMTCFSEILKDTADNVVKDLSMFGGTFNLMFFTDGYPVVSNYSIEVNAINLALAKLSKQISNAMLVGYGDYYNKTLMSSMAEIVGGTLLHSSHLGEFSVSIGSFLGAEVAKKVSIPLPVYEPLAIVGVVNGNVSMFSCDGGKTMVPENMDHIYVLAHENMTPFFNMYDGGSARHIEKPEDMYTGIMACAYAMISATKTDVALDLVGCLGDVSIIDEMNNAWTNAEYGRAQGQMLNAVNGLRYVGGKKENYIPASDAYCVLDIVDDLMKDPDARFYPRSKDFEYKRIGAPRKTREGYPKFEASEFVACRFDKLTWNKSRLNLSVLVRIDGSVELGDDAPVEKNFKCFQWRNYTLIRDGILNVTRLPVSTSRLLFDYLGMAGLIEPDSEATHSNYIIDLSRLPIVNRQIAQAPTSTEYCSWLDEELQIEYEVKYLKHLLEKADPTGEMSKEISEFSPEQEEYLAKFGIKPDRSYSPPTDPGESEDKYIAKEFTVKIAGYSTSPKVNDVLADMQKSKPLTPSKKLMADVINTYKGFSTENLNVNAIQEIKDSLEEAKLELSTIRNKIQRTTFAVILCKKWFPDLTQRDGAVVSHDSKEFTFSIRDIEVDY
jgi:hypothetical protein